MMSELTSGGFLERFGVDVRLLLAQVVNFLVLFFVLSRFVFRPLLRAMRARSARIAEGLERTEAAKRAERAFAAWEKEELKRVRVEATTLLTRTEEASRKLRETMLRHAEAEAQAMHDRAFREAEELRTAALKSAQRDVGLLVVDVTERVLQERLSDTEREAYLETSLREVEKRARGSR